MKRKKQYFKKFLIPHKYNQYHPHIFRNTSVIGIISISIFFLGLVVGNNVFFEKTVLGANIATDVLVDLANISRKENNVSPLTRNQKLDLAAQYKVEDMIKNNYFAHYSPEGTTPWYFIDLAKYDFIYAGENLAINFFDNQQVEDAWMNSKLHRENLLNSKFKDIGVSAKEGIYKNQETIYIVQMFGSQANNSKKNLEQKQESTKVKTIIENPNFITVKNINADNLEIPQVAGAETYSTWLERFMFSSSFYLQIFFFLLLVVVFMAFIFRLFIEYKKQHFSHLAISFCLLLFVITIFYINSKYIFQF